MFKFLLVLFIIFVAPCESCFIKELPGDIIECPNDEAGAAGSEATGSTCLVRIKDISKQFRCINGNWQEVDENSSVIAQVRRTRIKRGLFSFIGCILTFFSCLWHRKHQDTVPPNFSLCPSGRIEYGEDEPRMIYKKVYWPNPEAHDNRDGRVSVKLLTSRRSGDYFPEYTSHVEYEAKDKHGNREKCTFDVHVQILRCNPPTNIDNGYFFCSPSTEFVLGTWCEYGCYDGYELDSESKRTCQLNKILTGIHPPSWTGKRPPSCIPIECPALTRIEGAGFPSCAKRNYYRSVCTYNCAFPGFDMPPNVGKTLVCSKNKTWIKAGNPECIDVEPPRFNTCPSIVVAGTDRGSNTSKVVWTEPTAIDNSNRKVDVLLSIGPGPDSRLYPGRYDIEYEARDKSGNKGRNCKFNVIVRDIKCSRIYPTPYVRVKCPHGYRTGSLCAIDCDPGKSLIGSDFVTCEESTRGLFGIWNWKNGKQTTCKNTRKCTRINPPTNGAVVCDNWLGGSFCQAQCRNGTEMPSVDLGKLYVCNKEGGWKPIPQFKPCRASRHPHSLTLRLSSECIFSGDCTDGKTQQEIANNFIHQMQSSPLFQPEACPDDRECNTNNVQIFCGETSRKKRDVSTSISNNLIQHRLTIEITLKLQPTENIFDLQNQRQRFTNGLSQLLLNKSENIFGNHTASSFNISGGPVKILCKEGSVNSVESLSCIECPEGTYYQYRVNDMIPNCKLCPKGTYQDGSGQTVCKKCAEGFSTHSTGSTQLLDCQVACSPGTFSQDGLEPCSPCDIGHYQPSHGQTLCRRCEGSKSTTTFGASSRGSCQEFDIICNGNCSVTGILQHSTIVSDLTIHFWIKVNSASKEFEIHLDDRNSTTIWEIQNLNNVCHENICKRFDDVLPVDNHWHRITIQFVNCSVYLNVDGFVATSVMVAKSCSSFNLSSIILLSGTSTSLSLSQLNLWHGRKDLTSEVHCFSRQFGDLFRWQDFDGSILDESLINMPSQCDDQDNCISNPCMRGTCSDLLHGYYCTCEEGFTGQTCEQNIDDCKANVCMNSATCVDGVTSYSCSCQERYTGTYCEIEITHGQWSVWGNWSECTTTCGRGEMSRKRLCNNPTPNNGGNDCSGFSEDIQQCNNTVCPVCPAFVAPANGTASCEHENSTINCTIECDEGFEFDMEPLGVYYCGSETAHVWNFETFSNPSRRLPSCQETVVPRALSVSYVAKYKVLICYSEHLALHAKSEILANARKVVGSISVIANNECSLNELTVTDCDENSRMKRSVESAGLRITMSTTPQNGDITKAAADLETAFNAVMDAIVSGEFTIRVQNESYEIDPNTTDASGKADCDSGFTRVGFYCVPCGSGTYLNADYCEPCPVGTYQDVKGQPSCSPCPDDKSTLGEGSASIMDCSVSKEIDVEGLEVTGLAVGCGVSLFVIVAVVFSYRRYRSLKLKHVEPMDIVSNQPDPQLKGSTNDAIGPSKPMFNTRQIDMNFTKNESGV